MVKWYKEIKNINDFRQLVTEMRKISFEDDLDVDFELPIREFDKFEPEDIRAFCFLTECPYVRKISRRYAPGYDSIIPGDDGDEGDYVALWRQYDEDEEEMSWEVMSPKTLTAVRETVAYWATETHLCK